MPATLPDEMQQVVAAPAGGPEVLTLARAPVPRVRCDEVLIRVMAAGVNRADVLQRRGLYPPPADASPIIGLEVAGEVVATGSEVMSPRIGDRVCALVNGGGYAGYCVSPAVQCLPWPKGCDAIAAAALPEAFFTVWTNLFDQDRLARGESLLVHGGTSGIGVTAIRLAREFGARVFATAGSPEKCAACLELGAEAAIDHRREDFPARIEEITGGRGVDVILDIVGAAYFQRNLRCLAVDGRLVLIGLMQGAVVERFDLLSVIQRRLVVTGSSLRPRSTAEKGAIARALRERVWPILDAGRATPRVHAVFDLGDAGAAHRLMESGAHIGKIVLRVPH